MHTRAWLAAFVTFCSLLSQAQASQPPGDVIWPQPGKATTSAEAANAAAPLGSGNWRGGVFVLPYTYPGSYAREVGGTDNYLARQWVTQSFLASSSDHYDFVAVVTNFQVDLGPDVAGLYWHVRNDVQGIGMATFDNSTEFGSRTLQGYIDIRTLGSWVKDDGTFNEEEFLVVLQHELSHRWSARVRFRDQLGVASTALLGRDGSHWSYLLDSDASFLYGSDWQQNTDGTFTAAAVKERFSPLDLYLMGLAPANEVPPFTLLVNPAISAEQLPQAGDVISAQRQNVTVDQVIAAEGARQPVFGEVRNDFRVAVIYLIVPGSEATAEDIDRLGSLSQKWRQGFFTLSGGRGTLDVGLAGAGTGSGAPVNLTAGAQWLLAHQGSDGSWQDSPVTVLRDTVEAVRALEVLGGFSAAVQSGVTASSSMSAGSTELIAVQLDLLARHDWRETASRMRELEGMESQSGGWGAFARYAPDAISTARVARALQAASSATSDSALSWLRTNQGTDGGWTWQGAGASAVYPTLEALVAAQAAPDAATGAVWQRAVNWLNGKQTGGGFGDPYPEIAQTAMFVALADVIPVDQARLQAAVDFVSQRQSIDGSWEGSVHKTALALAALGTFLQPDPSVSSAEMLAMPDPAYEGDQLQLTAAVRNRARDLQAGTAYEWQLLAGGSVEVMARRSSTLPAIAMGGAVTITDSWMPTVPAGYYRLRLVIDPENQLPEKDESNNQAEVALRLRQRAGGVDLAISAGTVSVAPAAVAAVPQPVVVNGVLGNIGRGAAPNTTITVFDGPASKGVALGSTTVNAGAQSTVPFTIPVALTEARGYTLTVVADPLGASGDEDTSNNTVTKILPLAHVGDLEVRGLGALPASGVAVGEVLQLHMEVYNRGTLPAENVQVAFTYTGASGTENSILLQVLEQAVLPGATVAVDTTWRPNVAGSPVVISGIVDPYGAQSDSNRANNRASVNINITASSLPNLVVGPAAMTFSPAKPLQSQNAHIEATVENVGNGAASAFEVELRLDEAATGSLLARLPVPGLASGARATISADWSVDTPADRLVYVVVDRANSIVEFNEDDNQAFRVLDVQTLPDLLLTTGEVTVAPAFPHAGETVAIDATVTNDGDQPANGVLVELVDDQGGVLAVRSIARLEGHARSSVQFTWVAIATEAEVRLGVRVNSGHTVSELRYDNNEVAISVAVQSADYYVSERYFSPNGDGIRDVVNLYFTTVGTELKVYDDEAELVRTVEVPTGAQMVTWDGLNSLGSVAPDGMYTLRIGLLSTWVAVDNNQLPISSHPNARWLTGVFRGEELAPLQFDWGYVPALTDGEVYVVQQLTDPGTAWPYKLVRCSWEGQVEIGDWPDAYSGPAGVSLGGDVFLGSQWSSEVKILRYPGPTVTTRPRRYSNLPVQLSPDGKWLVWVGVDDDTIVLDSTEDPLQTLTFGPFLEGWLIREYSEVVWSRDGRRGFVAPELCRRYGGGEASAASQAARADGLVPYYLLIDLGDTPTVRKVVAPAWPARDRCWGEAASAGERARGTSSMWDGELAVDFARDRAFYLNGDDYEPVPVTRPKGTEPARKDEDDDRWGELDRFKLSTGELVSTTTITDRRSCFPSLSNDGRAMLTGPSSYESVDERDGQGPIPLMPAMSVGGKDQGSSQSALHWCEFRDVKNWRTRERGRLPFAADTTSSAEWSPFDRHIFFEGWDEMRYMLSTDNLPVRLQAHVLFGNAGINLWAVAADLHFDRYTLSYANADQGGAFQTVGPASREPLFGELWGTWLPPRKGKYVVQLLATDWAGNQRSASVTVRWNGDNDIANLYLENRYISPRSSPGVKDFLVFHYTVLRPCNLIFEIRDANDVVVRTIPVPADVIGDRTTTWDGTDAAGNPVPDGRYRLTYLGAEWPLVVDNTPPTVALSIKANENWFDKDPEKGQLKRNGLISRLSGIATDANLEYRAFERRSYGGVVGSWIAVESGLLADCITPSGDEFEVLPSDAVIDAQFRVRSADLAGNSADAQRTLREETLAFAENEPVCRSLKGELRCTYPDRPPIDFVGDVQETLITVIDTEAEMVLNPYYDTFVLQSTVWGERPNSLRLEYRTATPDGQPLGSWQVGAIELATEDFQRSLRVPVVVPSSKGRTPLEYVDREPVVQLRGIYWNHPDLEARPHLVRFVVANAEGLEVASRAVLHKPPAPLLLEYLGLDAWGPHFRITNVSEDTATELRVETLDCSRRPCAWAELGSLESISLLPGVFAAYDPSCSARVWERVFGPEMVLRARGKGAGTLLYSDSIDYKATLLEYTRSEHEQSNCTIGELRTSGVGVFERDGVYDLVSADEKGVLEFNAVPEPTGIDIASVDLMLDGSVVGTITDPLPKCPPAPNSNTGLRPECSVTIDFQPLAEGAHQLLWKHRYSGGQQGYLGNCPGKSTLVIDRTPPSLTVNFPHPNEAICPIDGWLDPNNTITDAGSGVQRVCVMLGQDNKCFPNANNEPIRFYLRDLKPGEYPYRVAVWDKVGLSTCTSFRVFVEEQPQVRDLKAVPRVFSPVNTLGRPLFTMVSFVSVSPAQYTAEIRSMADSQLVYASGSDAARNQKIELAWNGTNTAGALVPDGDYKLKVVATSPCGAHDEKTLPSRYDRTPISVDTTPPTITVVAPAPNTVVGAMLEVRGSVWDLHPDRAAVEARKTTECPTCWHEVASVGRDKWGEDEVRLGLWKTAGYEPGDYLVRVVAEDLPGNRAEGEPIPVHLRERRFIDDMSVDPELFSPNADTILDETIISFRLIQSALITLRIINAQGTAVATLSDRQLTTSAGETIMVSWNGKTDTGQVVPDARYAVELVAEDPAQPPQLASESERLSVTTDTLPPALEISSIAENGLYGLSLDVIASHTELHPERWELELGAPTGEATMLATGENRFSSSRLATLDEIADGAYSLELYAADAAGNSNTLTRSFRIDGTLPRVTIESPENGAVVRTVERALELRGTIVEEYLRSYTWSYAAGSAPAENDFATLYQGSETGLDGAVGFDWDASRVTDGVYTIRLQAIDEIGGVGQARVVVTIDNTPPTVAFTSPLDGAMIADPISIVGRAVDAHLESWTLSILDSAGEPQLPPLGQGQTSKEGELAPWAPLPLDSVYTLLLSARDTVGNEAEVRIGVEVASEPPLPPVDLAVKVANKRNAVLTWKPGTGSTPAGYNVYRDNERINTALVVPTTFTDPNLAEGTYSYMVRALSKAGKESADSNTVSVTINVTPPVAKITNPANGTRVSSEQRVVGTAFKEEGFKEYRLWLRAAPAGDLRLLARGTATVLADQLGVWNPAVPPVADGDYDIMLEAEDVYGNVASDTVRVTLDTVAPVAPVLTRAFSYAGHTDLEVDDIQIEWTIDPQPVDLAGFFLYRNGQLANAPGVVVGSHTPYLIADRVYKDEQVPDGTYVYYVTAADAAGNESPASNSSAPIVIETRRPHAEILNPEDGTEFDGMVMIEAIVEDNDVVGVQFDYQPVAGGAWTPLGGPVSSRPYTVPFNPTALGAYRVRATASDGIGPDPAPESITVIATVTVPAPAALVDGGTVTLTWPVLGSVGRVKGLNIYRDGTKLNADRLPAGATSYVDTDVADGSYTYTLTAVDQIDYETKPSPEAVALVTTPRWEFVQPVSSGETKQVWGNGVWAESEVTVERRESSGAYIAVQSKIVTSTSFEFQDLPLVVGFNVLRVRASDAAGNRSKPSADLVLVRATPPASPTNVAGSVQGADVTLSWQVAADSEVLGFPVWRNGSLVNQQIGVRPYNPTTDQLSGSSGALAEFALAVDGNTATSWSPATTPSEAVPAVWQWQWPERRFVDSVLLQWGGNARQSYIDIDVEANGQWLWAYSTQWVYYPGPLQVQISVGLGITGVRVRLPMPATCGSVACLPQLAELRLNTRAWTLASPFVESAVPIGGHKYAVAARNLWGLYSGQAETDVLVGVTPPPPPQNVAAQATADCAGVLVSWQLPVPEPPGLLGFVLWRQEAGVGEPVELAWLEPDDTSYLDRAVAVDRTYRYWLKSTALLGQAQVSSSPSNEAIVTTGCSTPLGPVIDAPTIAGLPITWSKLTTTVGGRALAGAHINLLHDGTQVATGQAIVAQDLFGFELPYYGDYGVYDIPLDVDGTNVIYLQQDYYNYGFRQVSADGTISELITPIGTSQGDLAQSSDGKLIGYVAEDPSGNVNLVLHDLAANEARWLSDDAGSVNTPAFSPDGRYLAYVFNNPATSTSNVRLRDLELGTTRDLLTGAMDQGFWAPTFSPNGQQLLVSAGSVFKLIELATGQVRDLALGTAPRLTSSPFSPDSSAVVFADLPDDLTTTATIWHCELSTGMTRQIGADVGVFAPAFLDQTHVACLRHEGAGDLAAVAYDLATGTAETLQPGLQLSALPFGGGSRWDLTANGSGWFAVPQWQYLYRSETASGRFRFDDVALHVGSNQLVAQQETSGSTQASLPIEVNVPSTLLPDARVEGFAAVPAFPLTNQQVVLGGTIRNAGGRPLEHCAVTLRRVTASGQNESLAHWSIDLAPGQATVLRHTWSSGALPGDSTFWLEIDPDDAIVEGDETNNAASTQVSVRAARAVEVGVTTDRTSYRIGNDMAMAVSFYSNGPATTFNLTTTIEDVAGALVDTVDQRTLKAFGPGSTSYNLTWKVAEIYPADYRVRVVAEGGESPASATAPFVVYAPLFVDARVGADRATIPAGSTLNITGVVSNRAFTRVSELNATLSIVPVPAGTPVASHTEAIANIAAGAEASLAWAWPARVAPGRYTIVLVVHDAGGIPVATSQPFPFTVTEAPLRILGRLQLSHSRREPGQQLSVRAQIDNVGDTPLALGEFTISIVDVEGNQVPLTTQSHAPLPTGQSHAWEHAFATDELKLQPYLVVLSGRSVAGAVTWQEQLATASVALVDLTPPALEVLSPKPGLLCNSPMSLRVSAQDALSGVLRVFYQADGGEQEYPLTIESLQSPSDIYASTWRLELEHQGAHRLAFRAEDFKGNISAPVEVAINANLAPPLLEVVGPEEGACLSAPTNVTFAGTGMVAATLNGQPYPSGQPISADGRYELVVTATDVCGRVQRDVRHFNVAIEAVAAELTFPLEGACAAPGAVPIINVTPTSATAVLTLNGQPYVAGTPIATAGSYTLVVSTANACGVPGPSVTRSFLIDGEAPVVAVTGVVEGSCYGTSVVPSFSATDLSLASTTATLNGQPFTSGATIDREGRYDLVVTATDSCGHTATTTRRFTLSWTPATVEVAFPAEAACARPGVVPVIRTVPDSSPVTATLDGRPYVLGTPISAQGEHSLVVSSADLCGRPGPALTRRFIVDGEPPTVVVTGVQDGFCYGTGVVVGYSATDQSQTTVVATLDGQPLSSGTTVDREGQYELVVTATDSCGQVTTTTRRFTLSWTPAAVEVAFPLEAACARPGMVPVITTLPASAPVTATLDGQPYLPGTQISAQGEHTLVVHSADLCGRPGPPLTRRFSVDGDKPVVTLGGVTDGRCYREPVTASFGATDAHLSGVTATLNGQALATGTTIRDEGDYTLVIEASDACGNSERVTSHFTIDLTPPVITLGGVEDGRTYINSVQPIIDIRELHPTETSLLLDGQAFQAGAPVTTVGSHRLDVTARDCAGNESVAGVSFNLAHVSGTFGSSARRGRVLFLDAYPTTGKRISSWLDRLGVVYTTTTTACSFVSRLRSGLYDTVVVHEPLKAAPYKVTNCSLPNVCPDGTEQALCQQLQDELEALVFAHGSVLLIGDGGERSCLLDQAGALGAAREGSQITTALVGSAGSIMRVETPLEMLSLRNLRLAGGFAALVGPSVGQDDRCDGVRAISVEYRSGTALPRPRRRLGDGLEPAPGDRTFTVASPLLELDREVGNPVAGLVLDEERGPWANLSAARTSDGYLLTITSIDGGALPEWLHVSVSEEGMASGSKVDEVWLRADCSASVGAVFGRFVVTSVSTLRHENGQNVLAAGNRHGLGLGVSCPWDVASNDNTAAWGLLSQAFEFARPEQPRPPLPGGLVPVAIDLPIDTPVGLHVLVTVSLTGAEVVAADGEPLSTEPLTWELWANDGSEKRLTFWVRVPEAGPPPELTAKVEVDDGASWIALEPFQVKIEPVFASRERELEAVRHDLDALLAAAASEEDRKAIAEVATLLAGVVGAPAEERADAECVLTRLAYAYRRLEGISLREAQAPTLRIARLIEAWEAVWSTR